MFAFEAKGTSDFAHADLAVGAGFALAGEKGEEFVAGGQFRVFFGRQIHSLAPVISGG